MAAGLIGSFKCVTRIAESGCYVSLFPLLRVFADEIERLLGLLTSLAANSEVVGSFLSHGAFVHVLYLFACNEIVVDNGRSGLDERLGWGDQRRALAGTLLYRLASDRQHSNAVNAQLAKFMPAVFLATLAEDSLGTIRVFDGTHDNPELIWNASMRAELRSAIEHVSDEALAAQRLDPTAPHSLPADFAVDHPQLRGQFVLAGVYVSLLLEQPAWQLRDPRRFLEALLLSWAESVASNDAGGDPKLPITSQALVVTLQANPALSPHVAAMGYLSKILSSLNSERDDLQKSCMNMLRTLSESTECVHAMRPLNCVAPLATLMERAPSTAAVLLPALHNMVAATEIVEKALEAQLPQQILKLLAGGLDSTDDPSAIRAHSVVVLKRMAADMRFGPTIQEILDKDGGWETFSKQEHDLFLSNDSDTGLLAHTGGRVGLLTSQ